MIYKIKLLPIVRTDLRKAQEWYKRKGIELAKEFKVEVEKEIDYISNNPKHYQSKYKELRQSLVTRFPYAIFYKIEEEHKHIIIFGILHTKRSIEVISRRIKK